MKGLPEDLRFDLSGDHKVTIAGFNGIDQEAYALERFQDTVDAIDQRLNAVVKDMTPEEYRDSPASDFALNLKDIIKQSDAASFAKNALSKVLDDGQTYGSTGNRAPDPSTLGGRGGGGTELT